MAATSCRGASHTPSKNSLKAPLPLVGSHPQPLAPHLQDIDAPQLTRMLRQLQDDYNNAARGGAGGGGAQRVWDVLRPWNDAQVTERVAGWGSSPSRAAGSRSHSYLCLGHAPGGQVQAAI